MTSKEALKELIENAKEISEWELVRLNKIKQDLEMLEMYKDYFTPNRIGFYEYDGKKYAYYGFSGTDYDEDIEDLEEIERFKQFKQWLEEQEWQQMGCLKN